ncbi:hypothetical protein EYF80_040225 [Liparis tanakae]|uniref:Uncharacterized protein n=1 Tax=Liparis tanakae TaxID=230148 RepID=A0A4Z2G8S8_9TELE|nr:hypothetical protein EYF80_040225 [Liparis tanakae]
MTARHETLKGSSKADAHCPVYVSRLSLSFPASFTNSPEDEHRRPSSTLEDERGAPHSARPGESNKHRTGP